MNKTEERIALEAEATALGEDFAWNISDEKLQARIAEAKAKADQAGTSGPAVDQGNTEGAEEAAETAQNPDGEAADDAQAPADGEAQAPAVSTSLPGQPSAAQVDDEPMVTVVCLRADGRRRGGRRWNAGETVVPLNDLSDFALAVLEADPMFRVER